MMYWEFATFSDRANEGNLSTCCKMICFGDGSINDVADPGAAFDGSPIKWKPYKVDASL